MGLWSLGSVADTVLTIVDSVPNGISGNLISIADRQRQVIEQYTGLTVGSVNIALKFQPALINLAIADILGLMQMTGADVNRIQLGDLNIYKGTESSLTEGMKYFKIKGQEEMQIIGRKSHYFRSNG